jgi:hypothetical protein
MDVDLTIWLACLNAAATHLAADSVKYRKLAFMADSPDAEEKALAWAAERTIALAELLYTDAVGRLP